MHCLFGRRHRNAELQVGNLASGAKATVTMTVKDTAPPKSVRR